MPLVCLSPSLSHPHQAELFSPFHNSQVTHSALSPTRAFFLLKRIRTLTASASVLRRRFTSFSTSGDSIYWAREGKENRDTVKCLVPAAGAGQLQTSISGQSPVSSLFSLMLSAHAHPKSNLCTSRKQSIFFVQSSLVGCMLSLFYLYCLQNKTFRAYAESP